MKAKSSEASGTVSRRPSPSARFLWFAVAVAVFGVSSFVALRQEPRLDAYRRPSPLTAGWWLNPIERNAPRRLPLVFGNLNDVFALRGKDAGKVWVVGEGGLVLHSDDAGRHWRRQYLVGSATFPTPLADFARSTLLSVQFVDASYGWVAGENGALFATRDGGERWERQDSGAGSVTLQTLLMWSRSSGLLRSCARPRTGGRGLHTTTPSSRHPCIPGSRGSCAGEG